VVVDSGEQGLEAPAVAERAAAEMGAREVGDWVAGEAGWEAEARDLAAQAEEGWEARAAVD